MFLPPLPRTAEGDSDEPDRVNRRRYGGALTVRGWRPTRSLTELSDGTVDNSKAMLDQAFADLADIGFTAVKADVPQGMTADEYRRLDQQLRADPIAQPVQLALRRNC